MSCSFLVKLKKILILRPLFIHRVLSTYDHCRHRGSFLARVVPITLVLVLMERVPLVLVLVERVALPGVVVVARAGAI